MAAKKISVTIDGEELAWLRQQAKRRGKSLSSLLSEAIREQRRRQAERTVLEYLGDAVTMTPDELDELARSWDAG